MTSRVRPARFVEALSRGAALFLGAFAAANMLRALADPALDANHWWLDVRGLPFSARQILFLLLATALAARALPGPWLTGRRGALVRGTLTLGAVVAVANTLAVLRLGWTGAVGLFPVPLSLGVAALLIRLVTAWPPPAAVRTRPPLRRLAGVVASAGLVTFGFALAQMTCFGRTDYRRPADAIVVLGARAYADGRPSHALRDRVLTACELYHAGLAPRVVMSGGPGDGLHHETEVMRDLAVRHGVPASAVVLDERGVNSRATVENVAALPGTGRVVVVSHAYHLPRLAMAFEGVGVAAFTVPAPQRDPLLLTPWFMAREVAAWWVYFVTPPRRA